MDGYDIIIADDHRLFRKGLVELIETMKEVGQIREAADGVGLLNLIKEQEPDLVILDLELPNLDGFEAAKIMNREFPDVKILVLSMYDNNDFIKYLWEIGIHGYLVKNAQLDEMYKAIISVVENDFYKNDVLEKAVFTERGFENGQEVLSEPVHLTTRERDVLLYLSDEKTSKEIGNIIGVSHRTVEKIRNNLMQRYRAKSVVGLVKFAIREKLIYV